MNIMYKQLKRLPLFQGVSTEKITALVEKMPFHFLKYKDNEQIIAAGEPCSHVKFIVSGQLRLETPFTRLKVSLLQTLSAPQVLAADYLFGRETVYPFSARAVGSCGILQLVKSDYIKMISSDKVFLFNILNYLSSRSQRGFSSVLAIKDGSVSERLASIVGAVAASGAKDITLRYKQKDFCSLLSTQRTTLIAALDKLSGQDIIEYDSNEMKILDPRGLFSLLNN